MLHFAPIVHFCTQELSCLCHILLNLLIDSLHEIVRGVEVTSNLESGEAPMDTSGQIFCHDTIFNNFNTRLESN